MLTHPRALRCSRLLLPLMLAACAAPVADGEPKLVIDAPSTGAYDDLVDKGTTEFGLFNLPIFSFPLGAVSTSLCMLSAVTGDYRLQNAARIRIEGEGWTASGQGAANCTTWDNFVVSSGGKFLSNPGISASMIDGTNGTRTPTSCFNNTAACADLWRGDAFSFINVVRGQMNGGNDGVGVMQSGSLTANSRLVAIAKRQDSGTSTSLMEATAYSAFLGPSTGGTHLARLRGYNVAGFPASGFITSAGTFTFRVGSTSGFSNFWLTKLSLGVCGFIDISGDFTGPERIQIKSKLDSNNVKWWSMEAVGPIAVFGSARCMAFDQR